MESINSHSIPVETGARPGTKTFNFTWAVMKGMVFFFGFVMLVTSISFILFAYQSNQIAQQRAFVVTGDGTLVARSALNDIHAREIEVRSHVSLFMNLMYAFDERNFERNIERALHLIGADGALILAEYKKAKMLEELIKTNGIVSIKIDSMWTGMKSHPYKVRVFARQAYETSVQRIENVIWADMYLKNAAARSDQNVAGLIIENFNIIRNEPVVK